MSIKEALERKKTVCEVIDYVIAMAEAGETIDANQVVQKIVSIIRDGQELSGYQTMWLIKLITVYLIVNLIAIYLWHYVKAKYPPKDLWEEKETDQCT